MPSGSGGSSAYTYSNEVAMPLAEAMFGIEPKDTAVWSDYQDGLGLNLWEALDAASSAVGGSPYELIAAYDPDSELDAADTEFQAFDTMLDDEEGTDVDTLVTNAFAEAKAEFDAAQTSVADADINTRISSAFTELKAEHAAALTAVTESDIDTLLAQASAQAETSVETSVLPTADIDAVVTAQDALQKQIMAQDVSRMMVGFRDVRAVMSSQVPVAVAQAEHQRNLRQDVQEQEIRLYHVREKVQAVLHATDLWLQKHQVREAQEIEKARQVLSGVEIWLRKHQQEDQAEYVRSRAVMEGAELWLRERGMQIQRALARAQARSELARQRIIAKMDETSFNADMEAKDATWDLEILQYHWNAMGAYTGAAVVPRAQTARERFLSSVFSSISLGYQGGQAVGSVGGGIGIGFASLAAQLWGLQGA